MFYLCSTVKKISTAVNLIDCAIILHNYLELLGDIWNEQDDDFSGNDNKLIMIAIMIIIMMKN